MNKLAVALGVAVIVLVCYIAFCPIADAAPLDQTIDLDTTNVVINHTPDGDYVVILPTVVDGQNVINVTHEQVCAADRVVGVSIINGHTVDARNC